MDEKFGSDDVTMLHNNGMTFLDFVWEIDMSRKEFVVGFHGRLDRISTLHMKHELNWRLPLGEVKLDSLDRNGNNDSSGGDYSLHALWRSLKSAYQREGLLTFSMSRFSLDQHQELLCNQKTPYENSQAPYKVMQTHMNQSHLCSILS